MKPTLDLEAPLAKGWINPKSAALIQEFYQSYAQAITPSPSSVSHLDLFKQLVRLIIEQIQHPYSFKIFHQSVRQPFDYYQFGLDFIRPLIDFKHSEVRGLNHLNSIRKQLKQRENVILLANHQTEPDPQIISLLLEKIDPQLAAEIIFVAGHRVISDPLAIPMSMGRHLLCIYSKKYINDPPEEKAKKVRHNQRTIKKMGELLNAGGRCIYVAPSGGRDRLNDSGQIEVTPFDPQSIELFWLLGQQAQSQTHFYPLALKTYHLMPPPRQVEKEIGEKRLVHFTPVYLSFGAEIDAEQFPEHEPLDKKTKRDQRAAFIWNIVHDHYQTLPHVEVPGITSY